MRSKKWKNEAEGQKKEINGTGRTNSGINLMKPQEREKKYEE
jgi:hypothetical protein